MKKWIQKVLGIDLLMKEHEKSFERGLIFLEEVEELKTTLLELTKKVDRVEEGVLLSKKVTLSASRQIYERVAEIKILLSESLPTKEENDIEKNTEPDEIDLTDGTRVPFVDGMKVRFEGSEGVDTEIQIG